MTPEQLKRIRHSLPARDDRNHGPGRRSSGGNGWTQRKFADALGISVRTYEGYERTGAVIPTPIANLARLYALQRQAEAVK